MMNKKEQVRGHKTREAIYQAIVSYIEKHSYPPSNREIGEMVGLKSTSSVHNQLLKMKDLGMIETDETFGVPRAIRVPGYKFVREVNVKSRIAQGVHFCHAGKKV